jgi:hypothetical protein
MFKMIMNDQKNNHINKMVCDQTIHISTCGKITKKRVKYVTDSNSGMYLRKMNYLIKTLDNFALDTPVYNPNKEYLVKLVNQRNSDILKIVKENIETLRLICTMDRNYRYREAKRVKSKDTLALEQYYLDLNKEIPLSLEREKGQVMPTKLEQSNLVVPGCDLSELAFSNKECSNSEEMAEIETLISCAEKLLGSNLISEPNTHSSYSGALSDENKKNKTHESGLLYELNLIGGPSTPVINDVWLNEAVLEIITAPSIIQNRQ